MFKAIFSNNGYVAITIAGSMLYYGVFYYLLSRSGLPFLVSVPYYLIFLLVLSSAALLAISIYSIRLSLKALEFKAIGGAGFLTSIAGSLIVGCECQAPVLSAIFSFLGMNAVEFSTAVSFISAYSPYLVLALIALNAAMIYHSLGGMTGYCTIRKGAVVIKKKGRA
jgi:hypothetical protein